MTYQVVILKAKFSSVLTFLSIILSYLYFGTFLSTWSEIPLKYSRKHLINIQIIVSFSFSDKPVLVSITMKVVIAMLLVISIGLIIFLLVKIRKERVRNEH